MNFGDDLARGDLIGVEEDEEVVGSEASDALQTAHAHISAQVVIDEPVSENHQDDTNFQAFF